jgi:hypothetical protein
MVDFDKRLEKLKVSYEEMPTFSSPRKIVEGVEKNELKVKKKKWLSHLPYVASFAGVLIIGSILAMQFFTTGGSQNGGETVGEKGENQIAYEAEEITDEDIAFRHQELVTFYNEEKQKFEKSLYNLNAETFSFVLDAKKLVELSASPSFKVYQNRKDLDQSFKDYTEYVRNQFELPKTDLAQLDEKIESMAQGETVSADVLSIIHKQRELLEQLNSQLNNEDFYEVNNIQDLEGTLGRLNQLEIENQELLHLAQGFIENGYHFIHQGEGMVGIDINYRMLLEQYGPYASTPIEAYLKIKDSPKIAMDAAILISWEGLAEGVVALENIMVNSNDTPKDAIEDDYYYYLNLYLHGANNTPAFPDGTLDPELKESYEKVIAQQQPGTKTYQIIHDYYQQLQKGNFKQNSVENFDLKKYMK